MEPRSQHGRLPVEAPPPLHTDVRVGFPTSRAQGRGSCEGGGLGRPQERGLEGGRVISEGWASVSSPGGIPGE